MAKARELDKLIREFNKELELHKVKSPAKKLAKISKHLGKLWFQLSEQLDDAVPYGMSPKLSKSCDDLNKLGERINKAEQELTSEDLKDTDSYEFSKTKGRTYVVTFMDNRNPQYIKANSVKDATQKAYKKWAEEEIMEIYEDGCFSELITRLNAITLK